MEQVPMIASSEKQTEESSACEVICRVLYGIFAQGVWLLLGGVVGVFAPMVGFLGGTAVLNQPAGGASSAAFGFIAFLTVPPCALVSAGVAFACLVSGQSASNRIKICAFVNCSLFVLVAAWAFFQIERMDRPEQGLSNNNSRFNHNKSNISLIQ
ncbi:unnamed protein product [Polarella glacialis]|uniref:Transmembrane protein n=1 Tax=Polarella glacialis TaxID=89957 RepID=A0A813JQE5_POLGL|nr:unnamed protein product [Polarella glacialis]